MTKFEKAIHETIKNRCVTYWLDGKNDKLSESNTYYFNSYEDNLFGLSCEAKKAYYKGSGNELHGKMNAIHSSSAMTVNIFGCGDKENYITVKDCYRDKKLILPGEYHVEYEVQLPVLNSPANLDVCLTSGNDDTVLLLEMKMIEWLRTPGKLRATYLQNNNRYPDEEFCKAMQKLIRAYIAESEGTAEEYKCKTGRFDAFQIMKHIFGIYNILHRKKVDEKYDTLRCKLENAKKIRLIIGYWTIPKNSLNDSPIREEYKKREEKMQEELRIFKNGKELQEIKKLFKKDFDVGILTVKEIVDCLEISSEKKRKMKRYVDMQ